MDENNNTRKNVQPEKNNSREKGNLHWTIAVLIAFIPISLLVGIGIGYIAWGEDAEQLETTQEQLEAAELALVRAETQGSNPDVAIQEAEPQEIQRYDVPEDDDPSIGPEDAEITIIEFSDYQCPYCQSWHADVFNRIREEYPDQVRIVYRDFPLTSIHPEAIPAALAANCAYEQDSFWEYHEELFSGNYELKSESYSQIAVDLDLDVDQFEECFSSEKYSDEIQGDFDFAANFGIQSTPTFFLNGIPLVGAQPFDVFRQVIEMELAGEIP